MGEGSMPVPTLCVGTTRQAGESLCPDPDPWGKVERARPDLQKFQEKQETLIRGASETVWWCLGVYDLAILFLDIYLGELKTVHTETCT